MFNFMVKWSKKTDPEDEGIVILKKMSGTKCPTTQRHIPEDWNLQQQP
jgi:hypothetical protein